MQTKWFCPQTTSMITSELMFSTFRGSSLLTTKGPNPSCPCSPLPQVQSPPFSSKQAEKTAPALILITLETPSTIQISWLLS